MTLEQELRDTLRQAADEVGPAHPAAGVRGEGMRALAHRRNRRRVAVLSAGLAVLVIGVGIPAGLSLVESPDNSVAAPAPSPAPIPSVDIYGGPTRGSLAGDLEFVEAVRQLSWTVPGYGSANAPPVDARRVVFAGDVTQGRWALVIGEITGPMEPTGEPTAMPPGPTPDSPTDSPTDSSSPTGQHVTAAWFTGIAGATPAQMRLVKDFPISPDLPTSLYNPTTGALLVVAAPGDLIEVSARPEVAADGTVSRSYRDVGGSDGVAVTEVPSGPFSRAMIALQYRVSRSGVVLQESGPTGVDDMESGERPQIEMDYLRPSSSGALGPAERAFMQDMAGIILAEYGLSPEEVTVQVPYFGPITSLVSASMSLHVVTATFPSGAVLTQAGDISFGQMHEPQCLIDNLSPAGEPAAQRSMAMRCDVNVRSAESSLIVIAPADFSGGYAVAEGTAGSVRVELDSQGVGMIAFPEGATNVTIFAADGTVVDEVPILTA